MDYSERHTNSIYVLKQKDSVFDNILAYFKDIIMIHWSNQKCLHKVHVQFPPSPHCNTEKKFSTFFFMSAGVKYESGYDGYVELSREVLKGRNSQQQQELVAETLGSLMPDAAAEKFRASFPLSKASLLLSTQLQEPPPPHIHMHLHCHRCILPPLVSSPQPLAKNPESWTSQWDMDSSATACIHKKAAYPQMHSFRPPLRPLYSL